MKIPRIPERWTIIGVSLLMVITLGLLVHGLKENKDRAKRLGLLNLDRAMESQRWRLALLCRSFQWDLQREADYATTHPHPMDSALLERWLPLMQDRFAITAIGLSDDRGDDQRLQRKDSTWAFTSTTRSASPAIALSSTWPLHAPPPHVPDTVTTISNDPREETWFSQAMEDRHAEPVWTVAAANPDGSSSSILLHLSLLIRAADDSSAYRVIHLDIDAATMLENLTRWTPEVSTVLLSDRGDLLNTADSTSGGKAWIGIIDDWRQDHPTTDFNRNISGVQWVGRIVPFDLNGAVAYLGVLIDFGSVERWNEDSRAALRWALALLLLMAVLLILVAGRSLSTERRAKRQERRSSLQARDLAQIQVEREVLDREVHHRVKNNLQVVSSLLNLQAQRVPLDAARTEFMRGKRRIDSMALVHHKLYRQQDLSAIDLGVFLEEVSKAVAVMHEPDSRLVSCNVDGGGVHADADTSIQLGMILCELLGNCYMHAFPDAAVGHIEVHIRPSEDGGHLLTVQDNGRGMAGQVDPQAHLGLEVVEALAEQLDGSMKWSENGGTLVEVRFKMQQAHLIRRN